MATSHYEIEFNVKGDGTVTAKVEGLMNQFRSLDTAINKVNQNIQANQKTLKGTVAYYDQQIDKISKLRDATANTSQAYKEQTAAIDKLKLAKAELTNSIKQVQMPMEGTLAAFRREIQVLRDEQQQVARNQATWQEYEARITKVKGNIEQLTGSTRMSVRPNQDLISSAGLAGATLTELGRTISDSNYGIRGMANNLSQLSTLFITLVSKTDGAGNAIKLLLKQLNGPLGLILVFQAVVALVEKFAIEQDKAKEATKGLSSAIKEQNTILKESLSVFVDQNKSFTERAKALNAIKQIDSELYEFLLRNMGDQKKLNEVVDARNKLTRASTEEEKKREDLADKVFKKQQELNKATSDYNAKQIESTRLQLNGYELSAEYKESLVKMDQNITSLNQELSTLIQEQVNLLSNKTQAEFDYNDLVNEEVDIVQTAIDAYKILFELQRERQLLSTEGFDLQRLQARQEFEDTIKDINEKLANVDKESQAYKMLIEAKTVAEEIYSEKWKQIRTEESEFWLDLTKKDQEEATKEKIEASKQQLSDLKQSSNTEVLARKSALSVSISDKKAYEKEARAIEKESIMQLIKRIQLGIMAGKIISAEGLAEIQKLQEEILKIDVAGKGKDEKGEFDPKKALDATKEVFNAGIEAAQAALDAELSIEEAKTAKINNELRKRLDNENLSAEQRQQINNQIAKNEEELQKKRDKIAEKQFKIQKALSIANTLVNTGEAAMKAYKAFAEIPPLAIAAAAAATAFGLAQVNAIAKQQFVPSAIGGNSSAGSVSSPAIQAPDFNVVGQSQVSQLAEVVQGQLNRPVKTYVVASDVSTAQELERKKISTATI